MTPLVVLAVAIAGGLGAVARLVLDGVLRSRAPVSFPLGTTAINVTGSFVLGLVTALALGHGLPPEWRAILGTGFIGGYTTFSTASYEAVRLAQQRQYRAALLTGVGMMFLALGAAGLGLWLGGLAVAPTPPAPSTTL
ncbi:chromosome condensation protein CrcB [Leifsonia xyli subsp. xyli]|uniref:Fluoride-specific ion channel FluC 1 n=2 Tax=Leifsonia xyli subsp. xyli TaxID=59736 RepID=FLUC1_LEIXX|nr:fluoride efflux transporter CrcB [Leifsonia xyli]Q6AHI5.1 RecName: Full=Fluoride-specific ion channel FluC 1 [Leifsonia xyli subsp. xyli str. CTCB07]AAT88160.1 integral membrane protein [Leifsonia xyli subsp. xyli str. CTCB07]ODA90972.1 chromosome condensation protein CrcB [Leifsonia xyli subsp. xyli]